MFRQIMVPSEKNHSIDIPKKWYGVEVEVLAFPLEGHVHPIVREVDADTFYDTIKLDFSKFKFNRDEANER